MANIFITGSSDGIGQLAAKKLAEEGHHVVLHARNASRAEYAMSKVPGAKKVLIGDLSSMKETKKLAAAVNELGSFDAIVHNAGVYQASNNLILAVNTIAPYILTCLINMPKRIIYISSGLHLQGDPSLKYLYKDSDKIGYADTKLHVLILSKAIARMRSDVYSNAVNPGWVPTKMGGSGAPDSLQKGYETQVWFAVGNDAKISGHYLFHKKDAQYKKEADDTELQDMFLERCEQITGIHFTLDKK